MAILGKPERIVYSAKNFRTGLSDVVAYAIKSNGSMIGPMPMVEFGSLLFSGIYYTDLITSLADPEGEWVVILVSPTENLKTPYKVRLEQPFPTQPSDNVFKNLFKTDIIGVVDDATSELIGVIQNMDLTAQVQDGNGSLVGQIQNGDLLASVNDSDTGLIGAVHDGESIVGTL